LPRYWPTERVAGRTTEHSIQERQLHHWKLLKAFQQRLEPALAKRDKTPTELDPRRRLQAGGYLSMMLFGLLNPVLKSTRGLCAASGLQRMQEEVCGGPVSLASFSEMQAVCEPALLAGLLRELATEAQPVFGDKRVQAQVGDLTANDGTLLPAPPRMAWALWQDERNRAGKLHLEFSVWRQVPSEFTVTPGNDWERAVWEAKLKPGAFYVNDRHYGHDYKLIGRVQKAKASVVLRLFNNTVLERLEPARALSPADRQAGVVEDVKVRLGTEPDGPVGRLVRVEADGHTFLLFTDREDLEAELVALIYRYRWQIELFFKWIKCILGCRHWLAESREGVTLQVYCALIASVLLVLWTGRKPTKRQCEALQLYWMGWATLEELERILLPAKKAE
jgi:DDE family transposase